MGHRKIPTIYTLTGFEGDPDVVVRMKAIRIGKLRRLVRLVDADGTADEDALDEILGLLLEGLVSWNLEDEDGQPVPTDQSGVDQLELPFLLEIMQRWLAEMTGPSEELGKGSSSGGTFPGRPLTMEAL